MEFGGFRMQLLLEDAASGQGFAPAINPTIINRIVTVSKVLTRDNSQTRSVPESLATTGGQNLCLVIEDEADTARYICKGLVEEGFSVVSSRDGAEGLRLATIENWDVVILDRLLPGNVDGLSILQTMRALHKATPVLVLSALASLDERVKGLRSGGDDYLTKPFAFSELLARVQALLRRSGMRQDAAELQIADLKLDLRKRRAERAA